MSDLPPQDNQPRSPFDADDVIGVVLGGRYRLVAPIGAGASARVYLADDLLLDRQVAVKCLRPGLTDDSRFLRRFRAEARATAQLSHPNLVAVYDWGEDEAAAYLVTEVLLGGSLLDLLERDDLLTPSQGLLVALQVAQGLHFAHELGWVHRDIKPANLLFGVEGRLRIADFGIARAVAEAAWTEPEGILVGTARYAAPEQADGGRIGNRADVYSLALTVVEAVTGEVPLLGDSALATMMLRREQDLGGLDRLGPLGAALEPAGRADPNARPSAGVLIESLTRAARSLPRPHRLPLAGPDPTPSQETDRIVAFRSEEPLLVLGADGAAVEQDDDGAIVVDIEIDLVVERLPDEGSMALPAVAAASEADDDGDPSGDGHRLRPGDRIKSRPIPLPPDVDDVLAGILIDGSTRPEPAAGPTAPPLDDDTRGFVATGALIDLTVPLEPYDRSEADRSEADGSAIARSAGDGGAGDGDFLAAGLSLFSGLVLGELESPPVPAAARPRADHTPRRSNVDEVLAEVGIADRVLNPSPFLDEGDAPAGPVRPTRLFDLDPIEPELVPMPFESRPSAPAEPRPTGAVAVVVTDPETPTPSSPIPTTASPTTPALSPPQSPQSPQHPTPLELAPRGYDLPALPDPVEPGPGPWPLHPSDRARGIVAVLLGTAAVAALIVGLVAMLRPAAEEAAPPTTTPVVESLVGRTVADVTAMAEANGWDLTATELRQDGTTAGEIVAQQPQPGRLLGPGGQLTVAVSLGPELRTVPSIVGRTVDEASAVLTDSSLAIGVITHRHDGHTAEGRILALRVGGVTASSQLETGTGVDLVVSAGPATAPMPSFVGLSRERALAQAASLGLVVVEEEDHSTTYPEGQVIHTEPPTGAAVVPGDGLTLVLSSGPSFAIIPDVVGLDPIEAADRLTAAGFVVVDTVGPPDQGVTATAPPAGESHPEGTSVVLLTET
ncbi:MAG: PASTA domain-containing protein [Acidimicrobiales bacterium]